MFEIRDRSRDGDGWTGVSAETLDAARYACTIIATEGYDPPLDIVREGTDTPLVTFVGFDETGGPIWQSSSLARSAA